MCVLGRVCGRWDVFSCDIICTFFLLWDSCPVFLLSKLS